MAETPDTDHFGFTRVGEGEQLSKNGFAALDLDRVTLDDLLYALFQHSHDNSPKLPDPAGAPSLIGRPTGGTLPPGTTLYYRISYLDRWGLETAASAESSVTTAEPLAPPSSLAATLETSSGGLGPGLYAYVCTFTTATGGETTAGPRTEVRIESGTTNRFRMDLPDRVPGATGVRVYRSKPGQTQYFFLFETDQDILYDDGIQEDPTITVPGFNSTNANNSVEVIVPGAILPVDVFGWKLYRSVTPGTYSGFNLVHVVVEGTTEQGDDVRINWVDTGEALQRGEPKQVSSTVGGGNIINLSTLSGRFPLSATPRGVRSWDQFLPGAVRMGQTYSRFKSPFPISPTEISAYFLIPPSTTADGSQVSLRVVDSVGNFIALSTDGSNGNYYVTTLPLTDEATFEAEKGERTPNAATPIITDLKASNGQAVELNAVGEYVQWNAGVLDKGDYHAFGWVRKTTPGNPIPDDITISAFRTGTATQYGTADFQVDPAVNGDFVFVGPVPFRAPGGVPVTIRITKATSEPATYLVDRFRYQAQLMNLAAGEISLVAEVGDLPDAEYPKPPVPVGPAWVFDQSHAILTQRSLTATLTFKVNDDVADNWVAVTDAPEWLSFTPATGEDTKTGSILVTADFSGLNPGTRSVATITVSGTNHTNGTVTVVALNDPAVTGGDVNTTIHY